MESEFIDWLRERLPRHPALDVGLGDDAAVVDLGGARACVVTTDLLTDGVDFDLVHDNWQRIGRKALAVNLSDLAAMAARPLAAVVSLALPRQDGLRIAKQLYEGLIPLAEQFDVALAGGDTNSWDASLAISITAFGTPHAKGALRRSGAQPGDQILVTGAFGGSILGKQFDFAPRVREAQLLFDRFDLHASIDVSDGLSLDLARLAAASGCGAAIRLEQIPVAAAARELAAERRDGVTPLEHALADGEDFELILAVPAAAAEELLRTQPLEVPISRLGEFVAEPGLWQQAPDGQRTPLEPRGYEHHFGP